MSYFIIPLSWYPLIKYPSSFCFPCTPSHPRAWEMGHDVGQIQPNRLCAKGQLLSSYSFPLSLSLHLLQRGLSNPGEVIKPLQHSRYPNKTRHNWIFNSCEIFANLRHCWSVYRKHGRQWHGGHVTEVNVTEAGKAVRKKL